MRWIAAVAVIFVALSGCGPTDPNAGRDAPNITVAKVGTDGKETVKLTDFKGKVVLIDFWATWCGPCKEIVPVIEDMQQKHASNGFEVLSISQEPESTLVAYGQKEKPSYTLYRDVTGLANGVYEVTAIPRTIVVGRDGKIVADVMGADTAAIREAVERAIG